MEPIFGLAARRVLIGRFRRAGEVFDAGLVIERPGQPVVMRAPIVVDEQVAGDADQPAGERRFGGTKASEGLEDTEEDVLRQVLRVGVTACEAITQAVNATRVLPDQILPG